MSAEDCLVSMPLGGEDGAADDSLGGLRKSIEGLGDDDKLIASNGDAGVGHNDLKLKPGMEFNGKIQLCKFRCTWCPSRSQTLVGLTLISDFLQGLELCLMGLSRRVTTKSRVRAGGVQGN